MDFARILYKIFTTFSSYSIIFDSTAYKFSTRGFPTNITLNPINYWKQEQLNRSIMNVMY